MDNSNKSLQPMAIIKKAAQQIKSQNIEHQKMKENFTKGWQKWGIQVKK